MRLKVQLLSIAAGVFALALLAAPGKATATTQLAVFGQHLGAQSQVETIHHRHRSRRWLGFHQRGYRYGYRKRFNRGYYGRKYWRPYRHHGYGYRGGYRRGFYFRF